MTLSSIRKPSSNIIYKLFKGGVGGEGGGGRGVNHSGYLIFLYKICIYILLVRRTLTQKSSCNNYNKALAIQPQIIKYNRYDTYKLYCSFIVLKYKSGIIICCDYDISCTRRLKGGFMRVPKNGKKYNHSWKMECTVYLLNCIQNFGKEYWDALEKNSYKLLYNKIF